MSMRLKHRLLYPLRTRTRAAVSIAALALLALVGWHGVRALRFHRDRAAAGEALAKYDFAEARRQLASCLDLRPRDPSVLLLATQAARRDGRLDEAQEHLDRYHDQVAVATPEATLQSELLLVQGGRVKEFVYVLLDHVEVRHPATEQILESLALGCAHVYRLDEASFWSKQLLDRFPHNPIGRLLFAQTYETLRRWDRALEMTRALLDDYPSNDRARLYLAKLLFKAHAYEESARHYREVYRRQPDQRAPLLGLVTTLLKLERDDEAAPLLRELEQKHADDSVALLECGRFALRQKRPADAEPLLRRALDLAPSDHEIHFELAVCLEKLGRAEESRRHLERFTQIENDMKLLQEAFHAMVLAPADPEPRLRAGRICLRNGQISEGLRWLSGVLDLVPNHQGTHAALAEFYSAQGDVPQAEYHRVRAVRRSHP